jgi:hypothetical protein
VLDPFAHDVERDHCHGDAILLNYQTGLTVDRTLQDRQVGDAAADIDDQVRDLLAAFDRAEEGGQTRPAAEDIVKDERDALGRGQARAEPSRSRQMRLATFVSQALGDSISACCRWDMAYQRAYVSRTTSSASAREPRSRYARLIS